jgi:hypothetical protein
LDFGGVGGNGDSSGGRVLIMESIEGGACFFAGGCFAGGYVDFGATGLKETEKLLLEAR